MRGSAPRAPETVHAGMPDALHIGFDLGGDTLKISFAYWEREAVRCGKISGNADALQIAIPAVAYYDIREGKWYFGDEIEEKSPDEYITVVKIKNLISMLSQPPQPTEQDISSRSKDPETRKRALLRVWEKRKAMWKRNEDYYFTGNMFPKFYFPVRHELLQDFDEMAKSDMTFTAPNYTPRAVCREFFVYVKRLVDRRKQDLEEERELRFNGYCISLVHPAGVGEDYLDELKKLVGEAFGTDPFKTLSSNKALALYAEHRGAVREGESFLVFDMGEESISVVQATIVQGQVATDGVEGHSAPKAIGGNDIDEAIVHYLEKRVRDRETFGTASAGQEGHIREDSAYGKQYMLMKDVKKAKTIFSKPRRKNDLFANGVPVTLCREVFVQCMLTEEDLEKCIGIETKSGIATQIAEYMLEEIERPINRKVKKVFVSGGVTGTYGLLEYIKRYLKRNGCSVQICTFNDGITATDTFGFHAHEYAVYAASVGGALVALQNIDVKTVFSLSYATWVTTQRDNKRRKCLLIFANRGEPIGENGTEKYCTPVAVGGIGINNEEMYSVFWTEQDVAKESESKLSEYDFFAFGSSDYRLVIGEPNSSVRRQVENVEGPGLKLVSGGSGGRIRLYYRGECVDIGNARLWIEEGIRLDKYGRATPVVRNCKSKNLGMASVATVPNRSVMTVCLSEIEPRFEGLDDFATSIS